MANEPVVAVEPGTEPSRSTSRLAAVQLLYEIEVSGVGPNQVLKEYLLKRWQPTLADVEELGTLAPVDEEYLRKLVAGVWDDVDTINQALEPVLAPTHAVDRLEALVKLILQLGTYELQNCKFVPARVVINEYMNVANAFFTANEPKLINGVLDKLAKNLREKEMAAKGTAPDGKD
jgi:N utilization substance protein B